MRELDDYECLVQSISAAYGKACLVFMQVIVDAIAASAFDAKAKPTWSFLVCQSDALCYCVYH